MKIFAGLGNPGREYEFTRHNTGFLTVDLYAQEKGIKINRLKHRALIAEEFVNGEKVVFAKPQTYMNASGESIRELSKYYNASPEDIIIIYDDISLPLGRMRIRKKGSAGGHNGIKSIIYQLQTEEFPRIKIGVSGCEQGKMIEHVLGGFSKKELETLREIALKTGEAIDDILKNGVDSAMNKFNSVSI